ncbi:F-box only protein 7, partial [Plakobranchus ocellatus]
MSFFILSAASDFQLSLNKRDGLASDEQTLSSFGIVSGDLLHIIGSNLPQVSPSSNGPARSLSSNDTHEPSQRLSDVSMLYLSATCGCAADAVWVVVHTLMLETGFIPQQVSDLTQIPTGWKQSGYYKCVYELPFPGKEPGKCSIAGVPMASSLIVHGLTSTDESFKTEHLQLKPADFVTGLSDNVPEAYVALDRLSSQVKDTICLPLVNELATAAGLPGGQGFTSLPYEIKIRILSFLDAITLCHVAQTGTNLSSLAKEKSVWRRLYIRDFG